MWLPVKCVHPEATLASAVGCSVEWNAACSESKDKVSVVASKDQVVVKGATRESTLAPLKLPSTLIVV